MAIEHVLAVAPVSDFDTAAAWYGRLFGRAPDNRPMPGLADWRITGGGRLQVWRDPARAGTALLNFAVDDLPAHLEALADRGLAPGEVQEADKGVRLSSLTDPDGNRLTFIGGFRTTV
ncbi:VOC family protein [Nocardiopsis halophila]|uniref:VOC family protein n=1 Tax=Nocardiopsis halophila TaxID=141692 RepID=UPI000348CF9A|nr:VOC family protein [Nocardiopsis halophila]